MNSIYKTLNFILERIHLREKCECNGLVVGDVSLLLPLYYSSYLGSNYSPFYKQKFDDLLADIISREVTNYSLGYGIAGLLWILEIIDQETLLGSQLQNIDRALEQEYNLMVDKNNLDYYAGALGILFYLSQKKESYFNLDYMISKLLEQLEKNFQRQEWYMTVREKNGEISEFINVGTPHGITGIILILLQLREKTKSCIDFMIIRLCDLLLFLQCPQGSACLFPARVMRDGSKSVSGIAWCYGDLMGGYALLKAGVTLRKKEYVQFAKYVLHGTINRTISQKENLCLCHGYTSLVHIYKKIYNITQESIFLSVSEYWKKKTLQSYRDKWQNVEKKIECDIFFTDLSLFIGVSGLLMSIATWENEDSKWINCLLV